MRNPKLFVPALAAATALTVIAALPTPAHAQAALKRLAAQFANFDKTMIDVPASASPVSGGLNIYTANVKVPPSSNVLYVTINGAVLQSNSDDGLSLNCTLDGANCNAGTDAFVDTPGWITLAAGDLNGGPSGPDSISYTWCVPVKRGNHTVTVNAATTFGTTDAFLETLSFYVDANKVKNAALACTGG